MLAYRNWTQQLPNTVPGQANATPAPKSHQKDASKQKN